MADKQRKTSKDIIGKNVENQILWEAGYMCAVPNCTDRIEHIVPIAEDEGNEPDNLIALCGVCYDRYRRGVITKEVMGEHKRVLVNRRKLWEGFEEEFREEGDRAAVIIGAAFLDEYLRQLIASFLIDEENEVNELLGSEKHLMRPLGSFSVRIRTAYCLGLISKHEYHDLKIIRDMRNKFAHKMHGLSLADQEIREKCSKLVYPHKLTADILAGDPDYSHFPPRELVKIAAETAAAEAADDTLTPFFSPRQRFEHTTIYLLVELEHRMSKAHQERRVVFDDRILLSPPELI
jgi:DNA-binding MltR family transcriptional regulator